MTVVGKIAELDRFERAFVQLADAGPPGPLLTAAAVLLALGIGAAHALGPGHGKAVVAAFCVGQRGRTAHAVALGAVVAGMHTGSTLVLGLAFWLLRRSPGAGDDVAPAMTLASGVLVLTVGAALVVGTVRSRRRGGHGHRHPLGDLDAGPPLPRRALLVVGLSGGLLPSPSAFLVLATAVATGQTAFGLLLVGGFSLGLAATLAVVGLLALRGGGLLDHHASASPITGWLHRAVPLFSALGVLAGGVWVTAVGLWQLA